MSTKRAKTFQSLMLIFWAVTILLPLAAMLSNMAKTDVLKMILSENFRTALGNSVKVSAMATLIAVVLAMVLAWCTTRTRIRFKERWGVLFSLPMLIPSISHGMGLVILFGGNGVLKNLLGLDGTIYGFWGIVLGSVMYSFPVSYLMLLDILKYEDSVPYEAATVLGMSPLEKLRVITLPYMRKPLISVIFATFTMVITDYGVPLMIGGKYMTLPVMMYQDVIGMLDFGKGSVIGMILLIPAVIACLLDIMNRDRGNSAYTMKPFKIRKNRGRDFLAYFLCILVSLAVIVPIFSFACVAFVKKYPIDMSFTFDNLIQALQMKAGTYFINSLIIAVFVTIVGVVLAIVNAYFTARMTCRVSRVLHLAAITSLAIPGIVLGLSYVLFFKGSFIYGTFAMLILVNCMHFFASPYLMMYNTFGKLNVNLEAVGKTLGMSRMRIILDVLLPMSKNTIIEMGTYFFVNSMMTISAVSFLAGSGNKPVALMITQFEGQMQLECAAFVSILILLVNCLIKGGSFYAKRYAR